MYWIYALGANGSTCACCRFTVVSSTFFRVCCKWTCAAAWILSSSFFFFFVCLQNRCFMCLEGYCTMCSQTVQPKTAIIIKMVERNFPRIIELFNRYCAPVGCLSFFFVCCPFVHSVRESASVQWIRRRPTDIRNDRNVLIGFWIWKITTKYGTTYG